MAASKNLRIKDIPTHYTRMEGGEFFEWPKNGLAPACVHSIFMESGVIFDITFPETGFIRPSPKIAAVSEVENGRT